MSMDVIGTNPTSEVGRLFRSNWTWWRPLWTYVQRVAPDVVAGMNGHLNNGDSLDARGTAALAAILREEIASGRTAQYKVLCDAALATIPDEPCSMCALVTTGKADYPGGVPCLACGGGGTTKGDAGLPYLFSVELMEEFRDFVAASGGFEMW